MKYTLKIVLVLLSTSLYAQEITLQNCYDWSRENFPITKKLDYIKLNAKYQSINANKAYFPQFNVNGQATYQSDVTSIPNILPDITMPVMGKDQYRIQGELIQTLFDGGFRTSQINMIKSGEQIQTQQVEINLHSIQQQVTNLYFTALILDTQIKQHKILQSNLTETLEKAKASLREGITYKSTTNELQAEILQAELKETELNSALFQTKELLSLLTGKSFNSTTKFLEPPLPSNLNSEVNRPELKLFSLQKNHLLIQKKQAAADLLPTLSAFITGGYGRPTLNMLSNDFGTFWMTGIKLKWSINTLMSLPNTIKSLNMNEKMIDADKDTFLLNTEMERKQAQTEIEKYEKLIEQDTQIIKLRESVLTSTKAQFENGIITSSEYIIKLNAENLAKTTKELHRILLLKAHYKHINLSGN